MAKKGGNKTTTKNGKKNWVKLILPLFLIFVMLASALYMCVSSNPNTTDTDTTSTDIRFNSIVDGLSIVAPGAEYVRYVDLKSDPALGSWTMANLNGSLPDPDTFGAQPQKDMLVNYPDEYFSSYTEQWVSITDFGPDYEIKGFNTTTYEGVQMAVINSVYTFTVERPTISGRVQNVVGMASFWSALVNGYTNRTAYSDYYDLTQQLKGYPVNASQARLAVVGKTSLFNASDRYYAGITPAGNGTYNYQAVLHLNQTMNETEKQEIKSRYDQLGLVVAGFDSYNIEFQGDYMILQAKGNLTTCTNDMATNWRFLKA